VLSEPPYIIPHADSSMSGSYIVQGISTEDCHYLLSDTIRLYVHKSRHFDARDTIVENQLPWSRFDTLFYTETDTVITLSQSTLSFDSIYNYHLRIYYNVADTLLYYACESKLPVQYDTATLYQEGQYPFLFTGSHGQDSNITFILHIIPNSDTTIRDSITESQLPWFAFDTLFTDTVADYIYHLYNEAGCDSIIHYNLYIFWNGDHCDTALSYPNVVTPNGDGVNDRFVIGGLIEHNCFKYNELTIYDRYGHCVYHKRNIANESDWWNPAAQRAPSGTYFYYFKAHGVNI
jgi:gliding motility-associated-like protein